MTNRHRLTAVENVEDSDGWLFTVRDEYDRNQEVILVPCDDEEGGIRAWVNNCTHENQRLYREEIGVVMRGGGIVCPKHGSIFESCSGECENGPAADTTLQDVNITVEGGQVYLTDENVDFLWAGGDTDDEDDDTPSSTSHLRF